jgi:hypothetical protein
MAPDAYSDFMLRQVASLGNSALALAMCEGGR